MEVFQGLNETLPNESSVQKMSNLVRKYLVLCFKKKTKKNTKTHKVSYNSGGHPITGCKSNGVSKLQIRLCRNLMIYLAA